MILLRIAVLIQTLLAKVSLCCCVEVARVFMIKPNEPSLLLDEQEGSNLECNDDGNLADEREDWLESHKRTLGRPGSQGSTVGLAKPEDSSRSGD